MNASVLTGSGSAPSGSGSKSFSNRPRDGSSSVGPLIGHKRSRSWGVEQALFNPSATTRVVSHYSNPSLNYRLFAQAFSEGWQTGYKANMPVFVHIDKTQNHQFRVVASIQLINYYLALASCDRDFLIQYLRNKKMKISLIPGISKEDFENRRGRGEAGMKVSGASDDNKEFIRDFMKKWSLFGVINNDMDIKSDLQKLFNVTVRGRCRVFNLWDATKVKQGSRLYLRLELVDWNPNLHFIAPDSSRMSSLPPSAKWGGKVWQLRAYTHRELSAIARSARRAAINEGLSTNGITVEGHFYCGTVLNSVARRPDDYFRDRAGRDHKQMIQLPSIEVALHTLA